MANPTLVRVLKVPRTSGAFCFGGGNPQRWIEVDWFHDEGLPLIAENEEAYREMLSRKPYNDGSALLVLGEKHVFTMNYEA